MRNKFDDDDDEEFLLICIFLAAFFTFAITLLIVWGM